MRQPRKTCHRPTNVWGSRGVTALAAVLLLLAPGCFSMQHTVGAGPMAGDEVTVKQWSAAWGLVPLEPTDSADLVQPGTTDYRVTTEFTLVDVIVSSFTSFFGFYRQTIHVES